MTMSSSPNPHQHHILQSRDSGCVSAHDYHPLNNESRLSQTSPLTPHSLPELRSTSQSITIIISFHIISFHIISLFYSFHIIIFLFN